MRTQHASGFREKSTSIAGEKHEELVRVQRDGFNQTARTRHSPLEKERPDEQKAEAEWAGVRWFAGGSTQSDGGEDQTVGDKSMI